MHQLPADRDELPFGGLQLGGPPGARIKGFHRGFHSEFEWSAPTDPQHLAWRSARCVTVKLKHAPTNSVLKPARPQLGRILGLNEALFAHVLDAAPSGVETLGALVAGTILGYLALRTRSIWPGVLLHGGIALTMDVLAMWQKGAWG